MLTKQKIKEVKGQIKEITRKVEEDLNQMLEQASRCGALSEEMKKLDNWLLAKALIDIWCQKRVYKPTQIYEKDFKNLAYFI